MAEMHVPHDAGGSGRRPGPTTGDLSKDPTLIDWGRVRALIEHEDLLINHRVTWNVQINAMLLGAFGAGVYATSTRAAAGSGAGDVSIAATVLPVLTVFGAVVSLITVRSVKLANDQIDRLVGWWSGRIRDGAGLHPPLVGEAKRWYDRGLKYSYVVPLTFMLLWVLLGIAYLRGVVT